MSRHVLTAVAWPYANGPRHIGHVSGFGVPSDIFARYMRMSGHDVLMVSGTDEHGRKVYRYLGRDSIFQEVEHSLRRLKTDYIDLYITHWQDATTPVAETMGALLNLKKQGKIRAIGVSNVTSEELQAYLAEGPVDAIQERYSMLDRAIESTLLPICRDHNIATLSYSSLALGLLSGKIDTHRIFQGDDLRKDNPRFAPANLKRVAEFMAAIRPIADARNASPAQIVIAWTIAQPGITYALCGARNADQARENARAGAGCDGMARGDDAAHRWRSQNLGMNSGTSTSIRSKPPSGSHLSLSGTGKYDRNE